MVYIILYDLFEIEEYRSLEPAGVWRAVSSSTTRTVFGVSTKVTVVFYLDPQRLIVEDPR